jgi:thymidylate synthase ThyX
MQKLQQLALCPNYGDRIIQIDRTVLMILSEEVLREADQVAAVALVESYKAYNQLLELGVAKECAREVLPLATPTRLYMNGTIRSWLHYCDLRTANGTQRNTPR